MIDFGPAIASKVTSWCALAAWVCAGHLWAATGLEELKVRTVRKPLAGVTNFTCTRDIRCLAKTSRHWWVGTSGGLARLNAETFALERLYTPADGLAGTVVISLLADGDALWVGCLGGVSRIAEDASTVRTVFHDRYRWHLDLDPSTGHVWAIYLDAVIRLDRGLERVVKYQLGKAICAAAREGKVLWVIRAVTGHERPCRVIRLDMETGQRQERHVQMPDFLGHLRLTIGTECLWAWSTGYSSRNGSPLVRIRKDTLEAQPQTVESGLPHERIRQVISVGPDMWARTAGEWDDQAYLSTGGKLCRYDRSTQRWRTVEAVSGFKHDESTALCEIDGELMAISGPREMRLDPNGRRWSQCDVAGRVVTDMCVDRTGTCWVGSAPYPRALVPAYSARISALAQLCRRRESGDWLAPTTVPWAWGAPEPDGDVSFVPATQVRRRLSEARKKAAASRGPSWRHSQRPEGGVSCVESDGERVWAGTFGQGVFCLAKNRWHRLWPKTRDVLRPVDGRRSCWPREDTVSSMVLDGDSLWIATYAGLRRYQVSSGTLEAIDNTLVGFTPPDKVWKVCASASALRDAPVVAAAAGCIWFSAHQMCNGVYCFGRERGKWQCVLPETTAHDFAGDGSLVWMTTHRRLLCHDTKTSRTQSFSVRDGLLVGYGVHCVAVHGPFVAVGTRYGISMLDTRELARP